jgi:hypothetical protein
MLSVDDVNGAQKQQQVHRGDCQQSDGIARPLKIHHCRFRQIQVGNEEQSGNGGIKPENWRRNQGRSNQSASVLMINMQELYHG